MNSVLLPVRDVV